jgi:hypothetical protein
MELNDPQKESRRRLKEKLDRGRREEKFRGLPGGMY